MNKKESLEIINTKQLRNDLPEIVRQTRLGKSFLVLYRSRPAFRLLPAEDPPGELPPLEADSVFATGALEVSHDNLTSADHDRILYGR